MTLSLKYTEPLFEDVVSPNIILIEKKEEAEIVALYLPRNSDLVTLPLPCFHLKKSFSFDTKYISRSLKKKDDFSLFGQWPEGLKFLLMFKFYFINVQNNLRLRYIVNWTLYLKYNRGCETLQNMHQQLKPAVSVMDRIRLISLPRVAE